MTFLRQSNSKGYTHTPYICTMASIPVLRYGKCTEAISASVTLISPSKALDIQRALDLYWKTPQRALAEWLGRAIRNKCHASSNKCLVVTRVVMKNSAAPIGTGR